MKSKIQNELQYFALNLDIGDLIETFIICSIASILIIRVFLSLTGYPSISSDTLHIAHMLWGGLLMLIAIVLLLSFLNKEVRYVSAVIGGIGFGVFIDELGKFITSDNNYFYEPTFAYIYLVFIFIFLSYRVLDRYINKTPRTYAVNAIELIKDLVFYDLDKEEKKQALDYLKQADQNNPLVLGLIDLLQNVRANSGVDVGLVTKVKRYIKSKFDILAQNKLFTKILIGIFIFSTYVNFIVAILFINDDFLFFEIGFIISSSISAILVIIGIYNFRKNKREDGLEMFLYSTLINIFLTQFFLFYEHQLISIINLIGNIIVYAIIKYSIAQEKTISRLA